MSGSEHMIREFNEQWEKDYVRKTAETLEPQTVGRKRAADQNAQREDIDETMGEGGGDQEEDGECEDGYEDGHGSGVTVKRPGTQRRKLRSFYFRPGAVLRTTTDNGRDVTARCQLGGHVDCKKILIMPNGGTQATALLETAHNGQTSHRGRRRRDAEFAEEYGEGVQTVDRDRVATVSKCSPR